MITEGYFARHHMGRTAMMGPALLDVAQDYALKHLFEYDVFELGVVLKGGTSLRKFRAGNAGRFSTDLDFAAPDIDTGEMLLDTLDGAELEGVTFRVTTERLFAGSLTSKPPVPVPNDDRPAGVPERSFLTRTETGSGATSPAKGRSEPTLTPPVLPFLLRHGTT